MTRLAAALAVLLAAAPAAAQGASGTLALSDVVGMAVQNSPGVLAAEQDIIIARQRVSEARFLELPQFSLAGSLSRMSLEYPEVLGPDFGGPFLDPAAGSSFYSMRVQAMQPLYTGGRNSNTLKMAKTAANQAQVDYETARAAAALAAKKTFYTVLYQRRLKESASYWLDRAGKLDSELHKSPLEKLEAGMLLSSLSDRLARAGEGLDAAHAELLKIISREPDFPAEPSGDFSPQPVSVPVSRCLVTAMESRPEMKAELYKAQMDDIAVNMAMVRRNPTIYLGASYDLSSYKLTSLTRDAERSSGWLASIGILFPLSYDIWTQVQQRRAQQRQGELQRAALQDDIRFDIMTAYREAVSRQEEAGRLGKELQEMEAGYEKAASSERPSMDELRALCSLCRLEKRYLDAVYGQLMARVRLEWAQGRDLDS